MRKCLILIISLLALNIAAAKPTSSLIQLPGRGYIPAQGGTFSLPLDKLIKYVQYDVTCVISNPNADLVDMRFDFVQPQKGGGYGMFYLNKTPLPNDQGSLRKGENSIVVSVDTYDNGGFIVFKNLDQEPSNVVEISQCTAVPVIKKPDEAYLQAANETNVPVVIEMGDFYQKPVTLGPHTSRIVPAASNEHKKLTITKILN